VNRLALLAAFCLASVAAGAGASVETTPYILGPGDQIVIHAIDAEEIAEKPFTIDSSGLINLPLAGRLQASGLTVPQFEAELTDRLKEYIREPRLAVTVTDYHSQPVSVIGAVNTPGVQQLRGRKTLIEVLSAAGGLRADAGSRVSIQRDVTRGAIPLPDAKTDATGHYMVADVNLRSVMDNTHPEQNITVRADDVISVPRADLVYVVGEVKRAGGFPLSERQHISVLQALALAEGALPTAAVANARILRGNGDGADRQEIPVNLNRILTGKTPDVPLQADDILFVPNSMPKKAAIRGIEAAIQLGTGIVIWRH